MIHAHQCGTQRLKTLGQAIGLFYIESKAVPNDIQTMAQARWEAKKAKDYQTADTLRNQIESKGYVVEDTPDGFRVRLEAD